jgi:hypothetical protein
MARQSRDDVVRSTVDALVAGARPRSSPSKYTDGLVIGYCTPGMVNARFCDSLSGTQMYDRTRGNRIWGTTMLETGPRITEARSQIVDAFLHDERPCVNGKHPDWLLMVDSDMVWQPDAPFRLIESANRYEAKIMGGLCIGGGHAGMFPTLYQLSRLENGELSPSKLTDWPEGDVVKVDATGAAFLLVHRDVYLKMAKDHFFLPDGTPEPHPWFIEGRRAGNQYGEDIGFCMRAKASGFDIYVDTSVEIGHMKSFCMDVKLWRDSRD